MKDVMEVRLEDKIFSMAWCFEAVNDLDHSLLLSSLSEPEQKMVKKFPSQSRAKEFVAGRYCTRQAFALYNDEAKQDITIAIGAWGYPFIEGSDANISIAHTAHYVMAACSGGAFPIGIDIENYQSSNDELIITQLTDAEKK